MVWDDFNEAHIWERHQATRTEVEEVCYGDPDQLKAEDAHTGRLRIIGPKRDGKLLVIIISPQGNGVFYPVTARQPKRQEIRQYTIWKGDEQP